MGFKYTVVCDTLAFLGYDFYDQPREILQAIKDAGYDGADVPGTLGRMDPKELREMAESIGLEIPEVLGAWAYFHGGEDRDLASGNPEARQRGVIYAKGAVDYAAQLGAEYFEICAPQPPIYEYGFPKAPIRTLRENFASALREINEHAKGTGVTILLEPLNPYEAFPGVLTTLDNAVRFIEELGLEDIGIQPDVFHMNISEGSMTDALYAAGKYVRHVHTNETNHYTIGTGHADYLAIIRTLKAIAFDGYLAVYMPFVSQEVFGLGSGYGAEEGEGAVAEAIRADLKTHLETPIRYLKQLEQLVDMNREIYQLG